MSWSAHCGLSYEQQVSCQADTSFASFAKQTLTRKFTRTRKLKVCIEQFQAKAEHSEPPNTGLAGSISFRLPGLNSARGPETYSSLLLLWLFANWDPRGFHLLIVATALSLQIPALKDKDMAINCPEPWWTTLFSIPWDSKAFISAPHRSPSLQWNGNTSKESIWWSSW